MNSRIGMPMIMWRRGLIANKPVVDLHLAGRDPVEVGTPSDARQDQAGMRSYPEEDDLSLLKSPEEDAAQGWWRINQ
jgi:hypothetical protein